MVNGIEEHIIYKSKKIIDRKATYSKKKRLSGAAARTGKFKKIIEVKKRK